MNSKVFGWTIFICMIIAFIFMLGIGGADFSPTILGQRSDPIHSFELVGVDGGLTKFVALCWFFVTLSGIWLIWHNLFYGIKDFWRFFTPVLMVWFILMFIGNCLGNSGDVKFNCWTEGCHHEFRETRSRLGDHIWCPSCGKENRVGWAYRDQWPDSKRYEK